MRPTRTDFAWSQRLLVLLQAMRQGRSGMSTTAILAVTVVLVVVVVCVFVKESTGGTTQRSPFADLYRNDTRTQCQETLYQPFLVGCPDSCAEFRPYLPPSEPLYRLTLEWYLGQAKLEMHHPLPMPETFYDMGYNYQCPATFVDMFGKASDHLETALMKHNTTFKGLTVKTQTRMHVSLAYLCCLRQEEAFHVREIMQDFVHSMPTFHVPSVKFDRVECWKERFNSITHIVVVDTPSQWRLLHILNQLEQRIRAAGIPVPVSRQTQMPFHSTLLGVQRGEKYSLDPADTIDPLLDVSFAALQDLNRNVWPKNGISFDIDHLPKFSYRPKQHTLL